jgi:ABC-type polysaccharide/polyol phosphate export permease
MSGMVVFAGGYCGLIGLQALLGNVPFGPAWAVQTPAAFGLLFFFMVPMCIVRSALGTQFRDLKHLSTMLVSALFLLSPVMFDRALFESDKLQLLRVFNPTVTVLGTFRAAVVHGQWRTQEQGIMFECWIAAL